MKGAFATTVAIFLVAAGCSSSEPADRDLLLTFTQHRPDFEKLAHMADEDYASAKVIRIAPTFTRVVDNWQWPRPQTEWGVSSDRWEEYRGTFGRIGLKQGLNRTGKSNELVLFPVWASGLADNSRERGVVFAKAGPPATDGKDETFHVTHIEGPWYLYTWVTW